MRVLINRLSVVNIGRCLNAAPFCLEDDMLHVMKLKDLLALALDVVEYVGVLQLEPVNDSNIHFINVFKYTRVESDNGSEVYYPEICVQITDGNQVIKEVTFCRAVEILEYGQLEPYLDEECILNEWSARVLKSVIEELSCALLRFGDPDEEDKD